MVSSTTPRLGPRWPPVRDTDSTRNVRISSARGAIEVAGSALRSAGLLMVSSSPTQGRPFTLSVARPLTSRMTSGKRLSLSAGAAKPDLDALGHPGHLGAPIPVNAHAHRRVPEPQPLHAQ